MSSGITGNLALSKSLVGLSVAEKISTVTRTNLTLQQKLGLLATSGLTAEELKNVASTSTLSTAQATATGTISVVKWIDVLVVTMELNIFSIKKTLYKSH